MLTMVMAKPILFTKVRAVPFIFGSALFATSVENIGESAITTIPQKSKNEINTISELEENSKGKTKQQSPDKAKENTATFFAPTFCDKIPPNEQETKPIPMIINESNGILK